MRCAAAAEPSAVAPGTPCRACHSRGRNGSGDAAAGHWDASSPQTHSPSKSIPAQVSGSMIVSAARNSCGSNSAPRAMSRSTQRLPLRKSCRRSRRRHRIPRRAAASAGGPGARRCRGPHPASRPHRAAATSGATSALGCARRGQSAARSRPERNARASSGQWCSVASCCSRSEPRSGDSLRRIRASSRARASDSFAASARNGEHSRRPASATSAVRENASIVSIAAATSGRADNGRARRVRMRALRRWTAGDRSVRCQHALDDTCALHPWLAPSWNDDSEPDAVRPVQALCRPARCGIEFSGPVTALDASDRPCRVGWARCVGLDASRSSRATNACWAGVSESNPTNSSSGPADSG